MQYASFIWKKALQIWAEQHPKLCVCVCLRLFVNFNIAENAWADLNCAEKEKKNTILYHF